MKMKNIVDSIINYKLSRRLVSLSFSGYLVDSGWINSIKSGQSIGLDGNPLPWVTYPFIDFIESRLRKEHNVFEFGSGNSTKFYGNRVKSVVSVEHDEKWVDIVSKTLGKNCELIHVDVNNGYDGCFAKHPNKEIFDIVIIDGRKRVECIKESLPYVNSSAVIILDDSERERYTEGVNLLVYSGYKRIDFFGMAPGVNYKKCTTIFYKEKNVLDI